MNHARFVLVLVLAIALGACKPDYRHLNHIAFKDSLSAVQDSLRVMNALLTKVQDPNLRTYAFRFDTAFSFGGEILPAYTLEHFGTLSTTADFSGPEKERLLRLALYLRDNHLSQTKFVGGTDGFLYHYHFAESHGSKGARWVVYAPNEDSLGRIAHRSSYKIIDHRDSLYLLALTSATIVD